MTRARRLGPTVIHSVSVPLIASATRPGRASLSEPPASRCPGPAAEAVAALRRRHVAPQCRGLRGPAAAGLSGWLVTVPQVTLSGTGASDLLGWAAGPPGPPSPPPRAAPFPPAPSPPRLPLSRRRLLGRPGDASAPGRSESDSAWLSDGGRGRPRRRWAAAGPGPPARAEHPQSAGRWRPRQGQPEH